MADPLLDICDDPPGIGLVPTPVKLLGREAELDDQVAGQVFRPFLSSGFRAGQSWSTSHRFSRQSLINADSSVPITILASDPPMKWRRGLTGGSATS
jgi:hypothetical protein